MVFQAGNTFLMLFAGHGQSPTPIHFTGNIDGFIAIVDTTAHTLDAALGFLALYPEIQDDVYREIISIMPTEADMVRSAMLHTCLRMLTSMFRLLRIRLD